MSAKRKAPKPHGVPLTQYLRELAGAFDAAGVNPEIHLPEGSDALTRLREVRYGCCGSPRFDPMIVLVNNLYSARLAALAD